MATVTITNTSVVPGNSTTRNFGTAGEAFTAGTFVYLKASDNRWYKADATTLEKAGNNSSNNLKLALGDAAAAGQPFVYAEPGSEVTIGSVVTKGKWYQLSATGGKMCDHGDLTSGQYSVNLCYAVTTTAIVFNPMHSGVTI